MSCSETVAIEYWVIIPLQIIHGFYLYAQSALIFILPVILISLYQCPILRALSRSVTLQNEKNLQPSLKKKKSSLELILTKIYFIYAQFSFN